MKNAKKMEIWQIATFPQNLALIRFSVNGLWENVFYVQDDRPSQYDDLNQR